MNNRREGVEMLLPLFLPNEFDHWYPPKVLASPYANWTMSEPEGS